MDDTRKRQLADATGIAESFIQINFAADFTDHLCQSLKSAAKKTLLSLSNHTQSAVAFQLIQYRLFFLIAHRFFLHQFIQLVTDR